MECLRDDEFSGNALAMHAIGAQFCGKPVVQGFSDASRLSTNALVRISVMGRPEGAGSRCVARFKTGSVGWGGLAGVDWREWIIFCSRSSTV
jgi:hypothetical protein